MDERVNGESGVRDVSGVRQDGADERNERMRDTLGPYQKGR